MNKVVFIIVLVSIVIGSMSFNLGDYDNVRVKGTFKGASPNDVSISLYDLQTKKSQPIDFSKNKFDFFVTKNKFKVLTVKNKDNQGKSVLISTFSRSEFNKRQQFIVVIDLAEKTTNIPPAKQHAETCSGSIKYSKKYSRFYYQKKAVTYEEILADIKEKTSPKPKEK